MVAHPQWNRLLERFDHHGMFKVQPRFGCDGGRWWPQSYPDGVRTLPAMRCTIDQARSPPKKKSWSTNFTWIVRSWSVGWVRNLRQCHFHDRFQHSSPKKDVGTLREFPRFYPSKSTNSHFLSLFCSGPAPGTPATLVAVWTFPLS